MPRRMRNGGSPVFGRSPEPPESVETLDQRIARLARDSGLSPRETEIVGYVGRGHSSVYVAKTLLISESTVYSHVRNVYRKLGVSSREELIQLPERFRCFSTLARSFTISVGRMYGAAHAT